MRPPRTSKVYERPSSQNSHIEVWLDRGRVGVIESVSMIRNLAEDAGFEWIMDKGVLAITLPGQTRAGDPVLISPQTGMVGYPTFVSPNIVVKALFNPNVKYQDLIQVQSELTPAYGIWKVIKLDLDLEAKVPHGKWFLIAEAINAKAVTPDQ